ncbi:MAG: hypothetical protein ABIM30_00685 [candidate division WOR-3 bacterium]
MNILNKEEVKEYYKKNYSKMIEYMKNKKIMAVQMVPHPVIRKYEKGKPIVINRFDYNDTEDHRNFFYYPDKHYVDFHIIHGTTTDIIPVDIDPNNVPDHKVRQVTLLVKTIMKPIVDEVEVFHSGGRGYHVIGKLKTPINTRFAKKLIDSRLKPILKVMPITTDEPPENGEIRLDTSTFHPGGSIRVPYSINHKTGVPSKKVDI